MMRSLELDNRLFQLLQDFPGVAGVVIREMPGDFSFGHNPEVVFPAASLIKLAILLEYTLRVQQGTLDPLQRIELQQEQIVPGSGIMQELIPGCRLALQDLATLMIIVSDNTATNMMIDLLGIDRINQTSQAFGLQDTILQRKMYDWAKIDEGLDNFTSPADMARILTAFLTSAKLSAASKAGILDILQKQRIQHKLPALVTSPASWAHKTGEVPGVEHDVGILLSGDKRIIVVAMTKDLQTKKDGVRLLNEIGRLVASHFSARDQGTA